MTPFVLLAAVFLPGLWAGVVMRVASVFLNRPAGLPPRPLGDCLGWGLLWWLAVALSWGFVLPVVGRLSDNAAEIAHGGAGETAIRVAGFATVTLLVWAVPAAWAAVIWVPEGTPRGRAALACGVGAAVWLVGLAAMLAAALRWL